MFRRYFGAAHRKVGKDRKVQIAQANNNQVNPCPDILKNKPQINADERRFVNLDIQRSCEDYPEQSSAIPVTPHLRKSAQSVDDILRINPRLSAANIRFIKTPLGGEL